jgi:hypothetical protein
LATKKGVHSSSSVNKGSSNLSSKALLLHSLLRSQVAWRPPLGLWTVSRNRVKKAT